MCRKSPSIMFVYNKIKTTKKSELYEQLKESPLTENELSFIRDIAAGFSITELSDKYNKSLSRISSWKREVCEKIHKFEIANIRH